MKKLISILYMVLVPAIFAVTLGQGEGLKPGQAAPDFSLKNCKTDKMVSLTDFQKEKGLIVIFTCNHCPYSVMYEDRILALNKKYAAQGFPVVAINPNDPAVAPDDSYDNMKKRYKKKKFTFPYLYDDTQAVALAYGATRTPHVFILKNTGAGFSTEYIGAIDDSAKDLNAIEERFVEKAIDQLLAGQEVSLKEAKAVGCTIKWKKS